MNSGKDKFAKNHEAKGQTYELIQEGQAELTPIFKRMSERGNLGKSIEQIIDKAVDLTQVQTEIVLAVKDYLKTKKKSGAGTDKVNELEKIITEDISEFIEKISNKDIGQNLGAVSKKNKVNLLSVESRKNMKRIMKNFVIYEIYKVMNPKRIAGETKKDNYQHNLLRGGEKLASKYEGGKESDLKQYGSAATSQMKSKAAAVNKGGGIGR